MKPLAIVVGISILIAVWWDAFEAIVLPRRVTRRFRLTRVFYRSLWLPWSALARRLQSPKKREAYLSFFGPLSLLLLLAWWAVVLMIGFGLLHWAAGADRLSAALYLSGSIFFTLGMGDVIPVTSWGRFLAIVEAGTGLGFLAIIIGYLPVIYQAFSRREVNISMLDARAGSPSSAAELLVRHGRAGNLKALDELLKEWERWSAELLESHLSYPVLSYYRSQHDNESWLAALTTILDACALLIVGVKGASPWQAQLTFAMARHAVVDLAQVFNAHPRPPESDRLPPAELNRLRSALADAGVPLSEGEEAERKLRELIRLYEPYANALSAYLLMALPPWVPEKKVIHNWQTTAWERSLIRLTGSKAADPGDVEHV